MSLWARGAILTWLGIVLAPLALSERESAGPGAICAAVEAVQFDDSPHAATSGARTLVADRSPDRLATTPFAAAAAAVHTPIHGHGVVPERRGFGPGDGDVILQPPARAPPVLS